MLPSRAEGLSNALLEAMACGLPVVVSDVPGNIDLIADGENGFHFAVDDPTALAQKLLSLLKDENQRQLLGRNARHLVKQDYSLSAITERYITLYEELAPRPSSPLMITA